VPAKKIKKRFWKKFLLKVLYLIKKNKAH
jgi:hypothetical protein